MAASARYFDLVREMKNAYNHRLRLVESAKQRGIKPTARLFVTTVPTVRKWLRRFQQQDLAHIKASWALFQQVSADTKDLDDIPRYWLQAQRLHLPVIQYTPAMSAA